jgi:nicotinamidase-related amidase
MPENPNPITIDNSVLILIDHQPWVAFSVQSIDRTLLVNNVAALATAAKDLGVPTVLTTVGASGGPLNDPLFGQISEVFPDEVPIDRVSTNAWADIKPAVEATGRRVLPDNARPHARSPRHRAISASQSGSSRRRHWHRRHP